MRLRYLGKYIGKVALIMFFLLQIAEAKIRFMPQEQLVKTAEYIVVAKVQNSSDSGKTIQWRSASGSIVNNELLTIESIKGNLLLDKAFVLNTLKFDGRMEDNVKLPSKGRKVLLFLEKNEKGELKSVNGIQGVWPMKNGKLAGIGSGTTLEQVRQMVQKQIAPTQNSCESKEFIDLLDTIKMQTLIGNFKEALALGRKAYGICPRKDLEEMLVNLMGEVGGE